MAAPLSSSSSSLPPQRCLSTAQNAHKGFQKVNSTGMSGVQCQVYLLTLTHWGTLQRVCVACPASYNIFLECIYYNQDMRLGRMSAPSRERPLIWHLCMQLTRQHLKAGSRQLFCN